MEEQGRSFAENYRDLVQISEEGADIYGSELAQDIVGAGCHASAAELSIPLLKMQLEQEWFFRRREWCGLQGRTDVSGLMHMLHGTVCECVGRRLGRYRGEARRGALLELIHRLEGMGQVQVWTQEERSASARLPEGELVSLAAERAQRHAGGLWEGYEEGGGRICAQGELVRGTGPSGAAAALAVAAYAGYPDLRCAPELLADVSAAAAALAHVPQQEASGAAAYMALLIAAASLVEPAGASCPAAAFFKPYEQLFEAELKLVMGAGAADLLAEAAAAAKSFRQSRQEWDQGMRPGVSAAEKGTYLKKEPDSGAYLGAESTAGGGTDLRQTENPEEEAGQISEEEEAFGQSEFT